MRRSSLSSLEDGSYDRVLDLIGDARFVLLGEASHGTEEFYRTRAEITQLLITERGFTAVAAEADWPDAYRVNTFVRGRGSDEDAEHSLRGFERFPSWMWRNTVVLEFVDWLRRHNATTTGPPAGFYGLDLYSMYSSMDAVLAYLRRVDPDAAVEAQQRYACFDWVGRDVQRYGYAAGVTAALSCEDEVIRQLVELQRRKAHYLSLDGRVAEEDAFAAEQNARVAVDAERYYREMYRGEVSSWNLRDAHMVQTLVDLASFLGDGSKIVVWAHNSHLGDARATEMGRRGEFNVGQLVRQRCGDRARLIGFTTYDGTVTAASDWGDPAEVKAVRPGLDGSYERFFHMTGEDRFFVNLRTAETHILRQPRLERAIGVIYRPQTERQSHYFFAVLARQFDGVIHIDSTTALEPLEGWEPIGDEPPETYPTAV